MGLDAVELVMETEDRFDTSILETMTSDSEVKNQAFHHIVSKGVE